MHRDQSPASIRSEVFGHRLRGLDEEEVRDYLDLLAEQVERSNAEIDRLRAENDGLRADVLLLRQQLAHAETGPQAAALLAEAQQVADQLVQEAVVRARDLMMSARRSHPTEAHTWYAGSVPDPRRSPAASRASSRWKTDRASEKASDDGGASIYDQLWRLRGLPRD
jgi:DivIVA domain-containing protein